MNTLVTTGKTTVPSLYRVPEGIYPVLNKPTIPLFRSHYGNSFTLSHNIKNNTTKLVCRTGFLGHHGGSIQFSTNMQCAGIDACCCETYPVWNSRISKRKISITYVVIYKWVNLGKIMCLLRRHSTAHEWHIYNPYSEQTKGLKYLIWLIFKWEWRLQQVKCRRVLQFTALL